MVFIRLFVFFLDFLYKGKCCTYTFELHRQVDAIQMGTHNTCLYEEVDKKYTGCNLKTMELLGCALIGVCAVIRSNTVIYHCKAFNSKKKKKKKKKKMKIKSSPFPPHPLPYSPLSPSERVANVHVRVVSFRNGSISLST